MQLKKQLQIWAAVRVFIGKKKVFDLAVTKYKTKGKHEDESKNRRID